MIILIIIIIIIIIILIILLLLLLLLVIIMATTLCFQANNEVGGGGVQTDNNLRPSFMQGNKSELALTAAISHIRTRQVTSLVLSHHIYALTNTT